MRLRIFVSFAKVFERNCLENGHKCFIVYVRLHTVLFNFEKAHVFPEPVLHVSDKDMRE